jgi:hypothetical protein
VWGFSASCSEEEITWLRSKKPLRKLKKKLRQQVLRRLGGLIRLVENFIASPLLKSKDAPLEPKLLQALAEGLQRAVEPLMRTQRLFVALKALQVALPPYLRVLTKLLRVMAKTPAA